MNNEIPLKIVKAEIINYDFKRIEYSKTVMSYFINTESVLMLPEFIRIKNKTYVSLGSFYHFLNDENKNEIDNFLQAACKDDTNNINQNEYANIVATNLRKSSVVNNLYKLLDKLIN